MGSQFKLFHANMLYSVKLKGVSYRKKELNLFVCLEQLVDGLEGKYNITRQNFKKTYCGRDFSLNVFSSNLFRGRPILLNRLVPCGKLNFVFCFVSFKEDLTSKKRYWQLLAWKSPIIEAQVTVHLPGLAGTFRTWKNCACPATFGLR